MARRETVLIVDDEWIVRDVAERMLRRAGYRVLTAGDGVEAVSVCKSVDEPIDLLLADMEMPRMNGTELARCLARQKPGMPVMLMTGNGSDTYVQEILTREPGLDGHVILYKPFTAARLLSAVEEILLSANKYQQTMQQSHHSADAG